MKKLLLAILFVTICASLFMSAASADSLSSPESEYVYTEGNTEVRIEKGNMTDEQIQKVLYAVLGKEYKAPQTRDALCAILGHDYTTSAGTRIDHKVYASAPRCVRHLYDVKNCKRCGHTETEEYSQTRIYCCP